ncbi:copper transporter 1-like [Aristolochia californica]|uniref:copper transporter 1-like n=1 Tax=Aristolochia californica TaxID=171875 RepID=UPI0035D9CF12
MMHMTFFWGKNSEILFSGWPGYDRLGMYLLALFLVFLLSVIVEWLSYSRFIKPGSPNVTAGLAQSAMHMVRVALAYMIMLAVMSFNVGVFLVALLGHTVGYMIFGSRLFKRSESTAVSGNGDLSPFKC